MIKYENVRTQGDYTYDPVTHQKSQHDALEHLAIWELGFGGHVLAVSANTVKVRTVVLNCVDVSTFSGTPDEMRPLVEWVAIWTLTAPASKPAKNDSAMAILAKPILLGQTRTLQTLVIATKARTPEEAERVVKVYRLAYAAAQVRHGRENAQAKAMSDMLALWLLQREEGIPFLEIATEMAMA